MPADKLISLKEASSLSGYSPDYIGQLIRSGKIKGEKVYCQINWMTTAEEVMNYKKNNKQTNNFENQSSLFGGLRSYSNRISSEFKFMTIFLKNIQSLIPFILLLFISMIALIFFILDLSFGSSTNIVQCSNDVQAENRAEF